MQFFCLSICHPNQGSFNGTCNYFHLLCLSLFGSFNATAHITRLEYQMWVPHLHRWDTVLIPCLGCFLSTHWMKVVLTLKMKAQVYEKIVHRIHFDTSFTHMFYNELWLLANELCHKALIHIMTFCRFEHFSSHEQSCFLFQSYAWYFCPLLSKSFWQTRLFKLFMVT